MDPVGRRTFHAIQTDIGVILALHDGKCPYPTFPLPDTLSVALYECLNHSAERRPTMNTVYDWIALSSNYDPGTHDILRSDGNLRQNALGGFNLSQTLILFWSYLKSHMSLKESICFTVE